MGTESIADSFYLCEQTKFATERDAPFVSLQCEMNRYPKRAEKAQ
jgi:hypothetical protein